MSREEIEVRVLSKAEKKEKKYDWADAADLYEEALRLVRKEDFLKRQEIQERIGYCLYRAAFQAETYEDFRSKMTLAVGANEKAAELLEKVDEEGKRGKISHSKAVTAYANSWIATDPSKKRELLDECRRLEKEALEDYESAGDRLGYGRACNNLLGGCLYNRLWLELNWRELERMIEEGLSYGEKAIVSLSGVGDDHESARAYGWTSFYYAFAVWLRALKEKRKEFVEKCFIYSKNALKLSKKTGDPYLIGLLDFLAGCSTWFCAGSLHSAQKFFEDQQKQGVIVKDKSLIGTAAAFLAWTTWLMIMRLEEDPDKQREGFEKVIGHSENAFRHLRAIDYRPYIAFTYYPYTESFTRSASIETDLETKRVLLERAVEVGREGLEHADRSGYPIITEMVLNALSIALNWLSKMETKVNEKRLLLEEALEHREKAINIERRVNPFQYWLRGMNQSYRALTESELAEIETDREMKRRLFEKAVSSMESCLKLCRKDVGELPTPWKFGSLGWFHHWFGHILNRLYLLTEDELVLRRAREVYKGAIEMYEKLDQPSRMAESHWEVAKIHDRLDDHSKAACSYEYSAENYKLATEKIPQLNEFYEDYSLYMQAWSEIEKARHSHARERYDQSREHYEKAADLHKSSKQWRYLSPNYSAWAQLERAEDLSRKEETQEAIQAFQQALEFFTKAKSSIETEIKEIQTADEREMGIELSKASDLRRKYCQARINLEEAKTLHRKGEHGLSSKRYGSAAEALRKIVKEAKSEPSRKELRPIMYLCQAWQKMTLAEEKTSPELYLEAAQLFEQAKEHTLDKSASLLALANSIFCKGLEAGTRFETTRDMAMYTKAKKYMEATSNYYLKAGIKNGSDYAKATQRLFDAYIYMDQAETETEPKKKTKYYQIAEKLLQTSTRLYIKAKHSEKSEEARRLLRSVKEERKLATALTEVLHAPIFASSTTSFSTPTPIYERSVGLERFEHAHIQANLILRVREVRIDEDLDLEIELINTGKAPALLIKVEQVVPQGFEVKMAPEICRVEDTYLNMKGRMLAPLKTEEMRLVLRPASKGTFTLNPRIIYLDETGKYKSHEPEPATITVKELGIKGWIKGEK